VLLALEATVRFGIATAAAEHLNITQAAVSHRIRELEEILGQLLFLRQGHRLEPTPAARILADAVRSSSSILQEALSVMGRRPSSGALTVSMLPAMASKWLAPRLNGMLRELHTVDLRITASRQFVDFQRDRIDAAMIEAAIAGTGVALGRAALVAQDISSGRLIAPFGHSIASRFSYWFVQDEGTAETFAHREFFCWAKAALNADSAIFQRSP
jgi:DNA-binding transcriptional LysR family regulator